MLLLRQVLLFLSRRRDLEDLLRRHPATARASSRFLGGTDRGQAISRARDLLGEGFQVSLTFLGEDAGSPEEATGAAQEYHALMDEAAPFGREVEIGLRLSQLGARFDRERADQHLMALAERAAERGLRLRIDMEGADLADLTYQMVGKAHGAWGNVGAVVPSQLRRSSDDLDRLTDAGIAVRLVKGNSLEPEPQAFSDEEQVTLYFMRLVETLMRDGRQIAIGTHDEKLVEFAVDMAFIFSREKEDFEFHLLLGMNPALQRRLLEEGYRVRIYLPYGTDWYAYFLRRLADRPGDLWRLLRQQR